MGRSPPRIVITDCTQCAAWIEQELLSTFGTDLGEVALSPGTGGVFEITYDGTTIWERKADGGFPEAKVYHYAWRGGPRLVGAPGSPEFVRSFHEAHAARKQPTQGSLFCLIAEFRTSAEYVSAGAKIPQ